jgi:hypothetical protein
MKAARGGVHDDGSVNDLDPAADILRERLVFLGTQAVRPVHPVRQGSHRTPPFLAHCQANGNWWLLPTVLQDHLRWSAFWDKACGVWRVAEDNPDSDLYVESSDADTVIGYIAAHS